MSVSVVARWMIGMVTSEVQKQVLRCAKDDKSNAGMVRGGWLPVLALAEVGDVGGVVAGVPGVEEGGEFDGHGAAFGVAEGALPLGFVEGLEEHDPTGVEGFDEVEGPLDRGTGVVEAGPGVFVVGLDDGVVFGEGKFDAEDGVHVGVGDVVDELADGPAAVAVGGSELRVVEVVDGVAEVIGELGEDGDGGEAEVGGGGLRTLEFADRVSGIEQVWRHAGWLLLPLGGWLRWKVA